MKHGTNSGYVTHKCRCDLCRAANTRRCKKYHLDVIRGGPKMIDATGTHRRIQALYWMGWTGKQIADRAGLNDGQQVSFLLKRTRVNGRTADKIRRAFEALATTRGPSVRTRARAVKAGWVGPMHWDDIDDPDATPWQDERTPAERESHKGAGVVNVDSLTDYAEWGYPISATAAALGVSRDAVERGIKNHAPHLRDQFTRNAIAKGLAA